jgi:hypothetical protein
MGAKTLYVTEEDEGIWEEVKGLGGESSESMSRLVTEGLRLVIQDRRASKDAAAAVDAEADSVMPVDADSVSRFRRELQRVGWQRAGQAFARACLDYGAAHSRAKRKADETMGREGRQAAARKAVERKGPEGLKAAAAKAAQNRNAKRRAGGSGR